MEGAEGVQVRDPGLEPGDRTGERVRAAAVAAASRTLGAFLEEDASVRELLAAPGPPPDAAVFAAEMAGALDSGGLPALRLARRRRVAEIASRDLCGEVGLEAVGRALAGLADACLQAALDGIGAGVGGSNVRLAVLGMGKLGGLELNYSSDIDVMFVCDGDLDVATKVAARLLQDLGAPSPQGQAYRIDANLRPEGRSGALVRSLDGYLEYYRRWAKPWEHQALIKARRAAGDRALGDAFVAQTRPIVFPTQVDPERIAEIRRMKERVEGHAHKAARRARAAEADDVKLGPGGIRDIEFSVQLLQLVHGGLDEQVRSSNTLEALGALVEGGYVAEDDGAGLAVAYRWLRTVEHRLQLWQERQVHRLPAGEQGRARLARVLGFKDSPQASAAERFEAAHRAVLADVRARFEKLFYRPMIESLADGSLRLSAVALKERLQVLGFRDVERAARTLEGLVSGTTRRANLFRVLSPALLRGLAATPSPDEGLFSFLRLGESLGGRLDALGALRDNPPGIGSLARALGSGRLLGDLLVHVPEEVAAIADPRGVGPLKDRTRLVREATASLNWRETERRVDGLRRFKRREMLRVGLADLEGTADFDAAAAALADLADACLEAGLEGVDFSFAVIGMGKLGGRELNYSSDIDVMFVHEGDQGQAERVAEELLRAIGEVTREGQAFRIDAGLRPEGKSGALARSLDSYLDYYSRWAKPWEHLALIKARVAAGDAQLGHRLVDATRRWAYPEGIDAAALAEIRHLKARMERERIPRGTDPRRHLKLGPGGTSDIEFAVQMIQRRSGRSRPELQTSNTIEALATATRGGLLAAPDGAELERAYRWLGRLRNRLFFLTGRPVDSLPVKPEELEALAMAMGYADQPRQQLEEDFLRVTRRVRRITEPIVYGPRRHR